MLRLILILLLTPFFCISQIPSPKFGTYINDYTNSLQEEEIRSLNEQIYQLEQQSSVQVAILLINDLPERLTIEEYARKVGNQWKVGRAHNGIIYVAALHQRKQRLEIARNLEGDVPDIVAFNILEDMKPLLKQRDFYQALSLLITHISQHVNVTSSAPVDNTQINDYLPNNPSPVYSRDSEFIKEKAKYEQFRHIALGVLVAGAIGFLIWAWRYKKKYREMYTINGVYVGIGSPYYSVGSDGGGYDSDSGGSSDFGGWGGDGGGGFDGGGASGDW